MAHHYSIFDNGDTLAQTLAGHVAKALGEAIAARGAASIAVSGGSTPKAFFRALSSQDIDWSNVTITLVDERFVPADNERSNHALVARELLTNKAAAARFIPLFHPDCTADDAASKASSALSGSIQPFDIVVLGMGNDGHTASFFPGGNHLEQALDPNAARGVITMEADGAGETRLTLNLAAISDARLVVLHIEGAAKKLVIDEALGQGAQGPYPIARVIAAIPTTTHIFWAP